MSVAFVRSCVSFSPTHSSILYTGRHVPHCPIGLIPAGATDFHKKNETHILNPHLDLHHFPATAKDSKTKTLALLKAGAFISNPKGDNNGRPLALSKP